LLFSTLYLHHPNTRLRTRKTTMAEPQRDLDKLRAEQEKDDADILDELEKESKAFDKVGKPHGARCRILQLKVANIP